MEINLVIGLTVGIPVALIVIGLVISIISNKNNYFGFTDDKVKFYMKKHFIYRMFGIVYNIIHHLITLFSIVFTLITVYMILDKSIKTEQQAFFLLMAAIFTTISNTIKFNEMANAYFTAMRIIETAILQYSENKDVMVLIQANNEAEETINQR